MTPLDYNGPLEEGRAFGRTRSSLPEPGEEEPELGRRPSLKGACIKVSNERLVIYNYRTLGADRLGLQRLAASD